jgi:drug/metabolite transporter (DMT)-like permease
MDETRKKQLGADLALVLVTLIWGSTFVAVQDAVAHYPVPAFLALRFSLATLGMLLIFGKRLRNLDWWSIKAGVLIGFFLFLGYGLQTIGLKHTTATKAGLITGLQTVSVPLITALWLRKAPKKRILFAAVLAALGLGLISLRGSLIPELGDLLVLGCAIAFGAHITSVGILAPRTDALALTIVQIAFVALASAAVMPFAGGLPRPLPTNVLTAAVFTGLLATALAFAIQNGVSKYTTPTHTGIVFAMEPVFAALFGYLLAGERLGPRAFLGGVLILFAVFITELRDSQRLARYVSYALNPLFISGPILVLAAFRDLADWRQALVWAGITLTFTLILPVLVLLYQLGRGKISDWHVTRREERLQWPLVLLALLATGLPLLLLLVAGGPPTLRILFANSLALAVVTLLITLFWKVSQHVIGISSAAVTLTILLGPLGAISFLLVPVVAWSRVATAEHTRNQTIIGGLVGFLCTILVYLAFGLLNPPFPLGS